MEILVGNLSAMTIWLSPNIIKYRQTCQPKNGGMELQKFWGKIYVQSFEMEPLIILYRYVPSGKFYARSFVVGNNPIYRVFQGVIFAKA